MKYTLIIVIILLLGVNAKSQGDCPNLTGFLLDKAYYETYPSQTLFDVDFLYKVSGVNTFDIVISNFNFHGPNTWNFNEKNLKEISIQAILVKLDSYFFDCSESKKITLNLYETKDCYKNLSCYIKVDQTNSVYCYNQDWVGGEPDWFFYQGTKYYEVKEKQSCGTACCVTTLVFECNEILSTGQNRWELFSKTNNSYGCDNSTTTNCLTNELLPCEADCE